MISKTKVNRDSFSIMFGLMEKGKLKSNIPLLKENCELLKTGMCQKTAGQKTGVDWNNLEMIMNTIIIETLILYNNGELDKIKE